VELEEEEVYPVKGVSIYHE